ncbi:hypothetical protein [Bradyrhizobium sp. Ec3.3]|uniref:hypothetical protein n=1 Tax=Bradyrhizobium sp. Ec3.3 TaxID=189753 RepID=UPI000407CD19|nr:hypothetical protein [Bradyrhizobium sp. Ec3.3]
MIDCKACGDYVEDTFAERQKAYSIITGVVASSQIGEHKGGAQHVASEILQALENAGLAIRLT